MRYLLAYRPRHLQTIGGRALRKLPIEVRRTIQEKARDLAIDPRPHGHVKLVDSGGLYRVRAGDYRIVYTIEDEALVIEIVKVADRKDVYGP